MPHGRLTRLSGITAANVAQVAIDERFDTTRLRELIAEGRSMSILPHVCPVPETPVSLMIRRLYSPYLFSWDDEIDDDRGPIGETGPVGEPGVRGYQGPVGMPGQVGAPFADAIGSVIRDAAGNDIGVLTGRSQDGLMGTMRLLSSPLLLDGASRLAWRSPDDANVLNELVVGNVRYETHSHNVHAFGVTFDRIVGPSELLTQFAREFSDVTRAREKEFRLSWVEGNDRYVLMFNGVVITVMQQAIAAGGITIVDGMSLLANSIVIVERTGRYARGPLSGLVSIGPYELETTEFTQG